MAAVQGVLHKSCEQIVDHVVAHRSLAEQIGFSGRTISQRQYWESRAALGILPFLSFFLALVAHLIRLGAITGQELIADSSSLSAWRDADPDATWQKFARKRAVFGYKVHTVLCHQADLPIFTLILLLGFFARTWECSTLLPDLNQDEASIGMESFNLDHYGINQHGVLNPLCFRG